MSRVSAALRFNVHRKCTHTAALAAPPSFPYQDSPGRAALAQAEGILRTVDIVRGAIKFGGFTEVRHLQKSAEICANAAVGRRVALQDCAPRQLASRCRSPR